MPQHLNMQQIGFFVILIVTFGLLITERIRSDIVAILVILALAITGILSASEALSGFGSEPAIIVVSIFIMSGAFHQTGLSETIGARVGALAGRSYGRALVVIMLSVALLSAVTHHVATTAVMLPVILGLCRERGIPASKLLMPLSIAASLGTTMTVYLPVTDEIAVEETAAEAPRPSLGHESVLVAEDELMVRQSARGILERGGYKVTEAASGEEALRLAEGAPIDLLVTDLVMPGIGGVELARRLRQHQPSLAVLFVSGYPGDNPPDLLDLTRARYMQKPFTTQSLLDGVRRVLDGDEAPHLADTTKVPPR